MKNPGIFVFCILVGILGCLVFVNFFWQPKSSEYSSFNEKLAFYGTIKTDPVQKGRDMEIVVLPEGAKEKIIITAFSRNEFKYGDVVLVIGKIKIPETKGDFDYKSYLVMQNITAQMYYPEVYIIQSSVGVLSFPLRIKYLFKEKILKTFPAPQNGLLINFLIGDKQSIPKETIQEFSSVGLGHIISVSGFMLTMVLVWIEAVSRYLGRRGGLVLSIAAIFFYLVISNFSPVVMRAAIMSSIFAFGKKIGRKINPINSLIFTAAVLVIENPLIIKYDLGFQLSFLGIAGIILIAPQIDGIKVLKYIPETLGLRKIIVSGTAAQITTLPVMIKNFHVLPLVTIFSNVLVLPVLEIVVVLGYVFLIPIAGLITKPFLLIALNYILIVVNFFASIPYSSLPAHLSSLGLVVIYLSEILAYLVILNRLKLYPFFDKIRHKLNL